jgi:hypothetical protein
MRVGQIVAHVLSGCLSSIHATRMAALLAVVDAVVAAGRLSLTAVGRSVAGGAKPKHSIKRVDRLLGNWRLLAERWMVFNAIAAWAIGDNKRPVVLVDWTKVAEGFHALVAALPVGGRALPLYIEIHREQRLGRARVQAKFLANLTSVMPDGCRPIVVTDAGFHGPFFREVARLGWDFLGRIRGTAKVRPESGGPALTKQELYDRATPTARDLGGFRLYTSAKKVDARVVLVRSRRRPGRKAISASATEAAKRESGRDPWLLATSLGDDASAEAVVATYALRMKIEETFRDTKNHRFGWSLRDVRCSSVDRLTLLFLVSSLAFLGVILLGFLAEQRGLHRGYQANTAQRRVLSFFVLGAALLRRGDQRQVITPIHLRSARAQFRHAIQELGPRLAA